MLHLENPFQLTVIEQKGSVFETFDACGSHNNEACGIHIDDDEDDYSYDYDSGDDES